MKIAILTSGILPVPAVQGGAVENLIDFYLDYNNRFKLHDITVFSTSCRQTANHPALQSEVNHYVYIDTTSFLARIKKIIFQYSNNNKGYYSHHIEYYVKEAAQHISKEHFDIIIMENRPAFALHFNKSHRLVYHLHNDHLNATSKNCHDIYSAAQRIICVSDYIKDRVGTISDSREKICTVYNGIDTKRFAEKNEHINRKALGIKKDDFVLVFSGRIIPEKGVRQLIEAMRILKGYSNIKLLVMGTSFLGNSTGKSHFVDTLNELSVDIRQNIIFTGYIDYKDVPAYLHLADIAVVPSVWEEPFGLTCIEALAAGLPLITTNKGGIPEITNEGFAELIDVNENFPDTLANTILALYADTDRRIMMKKNALLHVSQFDKDKYASNFFKALEL